MKLTVVQKADIVKALSSPLGRVELKIDGYEFTAVVKHYKMKLWIQWFVNGQFLGKWLTEECEERRRFCRSSTRSLFSRQKRETLKRKLGVRAYKSLSALYEETIVIYDPFWSSGKRMLAHLEANNESIELIEVSRYG